MQKKVSEIFGSIRFWQLILLVAIMYTNDQVTLDQAAQLVLSGSIGMGTIDSIALKFRGK